MIHSSTLIRVIRYAILMLAVFFSQVGTQELAAQCPSPCSPNAFNQGGTVTPISNSWQSVTVASGTYVFSNIHNGGIYTYSHCNTTSANLNDMQVSGTTGSACLFYNDDDGPTCSGLKSSVQWTSNFNGVININTNKYSCQGWIGGGSSNSGVLDYRCDGPGSPATYGNGEWRLYAWNAGDANGGSGAWSSAYSGYLTIPTLSFNTTSYWTSAGSPSDYFGFLGCHVGADSHSWSAKRTGFTCGVYSISIPTHDDTYYLYINGSLVSSHVGCCDNHGVVWTGILQNSSTIEYRVSEGGGGSEAQIVVTPVTPPTLNAGTITANQTICSGGDPSAFSSTSTPSGGYGTSYTNGSYTYQWYYQDNCTGGGTAIGGASGTTYDPPSGLTNTRCYYRTVEDACGNNSSAGPITVTVVADPSVTAPSLTNSTICVGGATTASVTASGGTGTISYQWQYNNGGTWANVVNSTPAGSSYSNQTTSAMSVSGISVAGSYQYRCIVSATGSGCNSATSAIGTLTVVADPTVSAPSLSNSTICIGGTTDASVTAANGTGTIGYQWQYNNSGTWINAAAGFPTGSAYSGITAATMTISGITVAGSYQYRCIVSATGSGCDAITSSNVTLTVNSDPSVTAPSLTNSTICQGGSSQLSVTGSGGVSLAYQWQYDNGGTWGNVTNGLPAGSSYASGGTAAMTVSGISTAGTYQYRCVVTSTGSDCNTVASSSGSLTVVSDPTVSAPSLTNSTICVGGSSNASVTAGNGTGSYGYQWQYNNGGTWINVVNNTPAGASYSNSTSATATISGITATGSFSYRCIVSASGSGCDNAVSSSVTLGVVADPTVSAASLTNSTICVGGTTDASVTAANGTGSYNYQWQYNNGGTWVNVANGVPAGAAYFNSTSSTMTTSGITAAGSYQYRAVVGATGSGCDNVVSALTTLTVNPDVTLSTPAFTSSSVCLAGSTSVSIVASGGISLSYQWQYNNGGTWVNVSNGLPTGASYLNATSTNLSISGIASIGSYQYRAYVTSTGSNCDPAASSSSTLTVNAAPSISIGSDATYCSSGSSTLTSSVSGGSGTPSYQWQSSANNVTFTNIGGATSSSYTTPTISTTTYYRALYSTSDPGCAAGVSNVTTITIVPSIATNTIPGYQKFCLNGDPANIVGSTPTGGTGSYTYAWQESTNGGVSWSSASGTNNQKDYDPPFTSSTIRYRRIVSSSVCSSVSNEALILVLPLPQVNNVTSTNVLCFGGNTGSITVTGSTSNGSVYYSNNGGSTYQVSGLFTGLVQGNYNVWVRDDSLCTNTYVGNPVVITQPTDVTHATAIVDASCSNVFDGKITVTAAGGTIPYSYSLNGGPTQAGNQFTGLASGTYLVSVFDANGCLDTSSVTLINTYAVTGSISSQTNVSCFGGANGSVTVALSGGIPPYAFSLNGGAFQASGTFASLTAGVYIVAARDAKGCTDYITVNITQPAQLSVLVNIVNNVACYGDSTGEIFISVAGGTSPYSYNWSNGVTVQNNINVPVGTYSITVTDNKGCITSTGATVTQPTKLTVALASVQDLKCNNDGTGRIDITVNGGIPPYAFLWSNNSTTEDLNNLQAGTYSVIVQDANGCLEYDTFTISQPNALTATITGTNATCNGANNATVDLTVTGGSLPYTFSWNNGATTEDLTGVSAGTYTVLVTDANNCTVFKSINITQPATLTLSSIVTNVPCNGGTGSINVTVTGGTSPVTYIWNTSDTSQDLSGVIAGVYSVTATDANLCSATLSATVTQPATLALTGTATHVTCNGAANGTVNITVTGGTTPYSYSWTNGATTEDISGLSGNTYSVTITDANNCVASASYTVNEPTALVTSIVGTNVTCYGAGNGSADLTVSGGTTPYTYLWSNFSSTQDIAALTPGWYYVIVTDGNSCTKRDSVLVTQPTQVAISASVTNLLCNGGGTGAINITVTGGVPGYAYSWSNGSTAEDQSGLAAGTYSVIVTDATFCTASATYNIVQPPLLTVALASYNNVSCFGGSNGNINVTTGGGTAPLTYSWSNGSTTEDLSGVPAGTYTLTVTDANNCTATLTQTVSEPPLLTASAVAGTILCNGGLTNVDLTVGGGTAGYSYFWNSGATTEDLTAVGAGTYTVVVTDSKACTATASVVITQPAALTLSAQVTNPLCNGDITGAINLTIGGGTTPYSFSWSNGDTTEDLSLLTIGTYSVTVSDSNSCFVTGTYTITQPPALTITLASANNVSCNGGSNGNVNVTVGGGVAPYTYSWSNGGSAEDLNNVTANTYVLTVTDANACQATFTYIVSEPPVLTASATAGTILCYGGNTNVDLTVAGGTAGYSYFWNSGATTEDLFFVGAGIYTVVVTDTKGCTATASVNISQPPALTLSAQVSSPVCNGANTGSINISVAGGTVPYSFNWSNGDTTEDVSGLAVGSYTVIVTDSNGCTVSGTYNIVQPPALVIALASYNDVSCNGGANGNINITISGGSTPYTFAWSNNTSLEDVTNIPAGTYDVTVTDANGCTATFSQTIAEPTLLTASATAGTILCNGGTTNVDLTVAGGTTGYTYFWNNGATTEDLTGVTAGTYTVLATDAKGCTATASVVISQPTPIVTTTEVADVFCNGDASGGVDLGVSGGTPPYTYLWTTGDTTQDVGSLSAGTHTVTITDANGCVATVDATVSEPAAINVALASYNDVSCNGGTNGSINVTATGGITPYGFAWSSGATTEDLNNIPAGTYTLTLTDANGCVANFTHTISEPTPLTASATAGTILCNGGTTNVDLTVGGGTAGYTYFWNNGATTEDLTGVTAGTYTVLATDAKGCTATASVVISQPALLAVTTQVTNVLCNGASTGAIDLGVTGGVSPYTYSWTNGDTTQDISNLTAGTYTVVVTDSNGCTATTSVTITQPTAMIMNATPVNVACAGGNSGSIDITVGGGVFPYSYAWSTGATTEDVNGLSGGTYSVTVTDANGCTLSQTFIISEPQPIVTSIVGTDVTCNGASNGATDLTVSGGVAPYSFLWNTFQTIEDLNNIGGGTYYVIVTDANGCTKHDSVVINEPPALVLTTQVTNVLCNGASTGAIDLGVTGGVSPYTYSWTNGDTTQDISNLTAGTYTVVVTDSNGCTATTSVTITQPTAMIMNATPVNVACAGGNSGSIDITVGGGVFPYSYAWSTGATTEDVNGLSGGTYSVTVTDANGCTLSQTFIISEPQPIVTSIVGTDVTCNGASNGATDLTVSGGVAPYSFLWNTFQTIEDLNNIGGGTYYVIVTDANGCTKHDSVVINEPPALVLTTQVTNVLCNGASTGAIDLGVTGGVSPYTYSWTNGDTTQDISNLTAGTYTVVVTDSNGCTATTSVTITQPTAILISLASYNDVSCNGGSNGSVDISVYGGVPLYTFAWSNGSTGEDLNNVPAGTYTVTVTDANGCTATTTQTISEPALLTASVTSGTILCYGGTTNVDLTVAGGVTPYSYFWNNGVIVEDLTAVGAGTYSVQVTDANNCLVVATITIAQPTALVLSTQTVQVLCNGANTGQVDLTVAGGTPNYSFSWNNGATTEDLNNLAAGTYCVTVTDGNGCVATACVTISQPTALNMFGITQNVSCNGGNNGAVNITVNGGVQPYTYLWSTGYQFEDIAGLIAGTHSVTVTDANGCTLSQSFVITEPTLVTSNAVPTDVTCYGAYNGAVSLTVSGGVLPYSFFWSNFQTSEDISGLPGGTYYVIVTDSNGCTHRDSAVVYEPAPLLLSTSSNNITCFNANNGNIDLTVTGGTQPYGYLWSNGATVEDPTNLPGGTYAVTVTDDNGCTATTSVFILNPPLITANFIVKSPLCFGDANGSIDLIPTGGTPGYTYNWSNGVTTEDISGLAANTYIVTITDSKGCAYVDSAHVIEPEPLVTSGVIKNVTCSGDCDGFIVVTAYGGTLPYHYLWSTGPSTKDLYSVCGGNYYVSVTDGNGCQIASLYIVNEPTPLTVSLTGTNILCNGASTGAVAAIPGGGTTPYQYLWDDFTNDSVRTGLTAGRYGILLTDSNGCQVIDSIYLTQPAPISITGNVTNVQCFGGTNGAIDVTVAGGVPNYTFVWSTGPITEDLANIPQGTYTVGVTDANSCNKSQSFIVTQPTQVSLQMLTDQPSCFGSKNGSVSVVATQGVGPYTYSWNTTPTPQTTATAIQLFAGNYTVTVTDAASCSVSASALLTEPAEIVVGTEATASKCFNTATGQVVIDVTGGDLPYTYELNGIAQATDTFTGLTAGNYVVIVTDVNGCEGTTNFTIASPGQISVDLSVSQQVILTGMETQLIAVANSTLPIINYVWTPDSFMNYTSCVDPTNCSTPYAHPSSTTTFTVTVMNSDSCTASDTVTVIVSNEVSAFIPTVFTPNGDGLNDRFEMDILGAKRIEVSIFNRWGERVYYNGAQQNGMTGNNGWDGTFDGDVVPDDSYVYQITIEYFDGTFKEKTGSVTVMK